MERVLWNLSPKVVWITPWTMQMSWNWMEKNSKFMKRTTGPMEGPEVGPDQGTGPELSMGPDLRIGPNIGTVPKQDHVATLRPEAGLSLKVDPCPVASPVLSPGTGLNPEVVPSPPKGNMILEIYVSTYYLKLETNCFTGAS